MSTWDNEQKEARDEIKKDLKNIGKDLLFGIPVLLMVIGFVFTLFTHPLIVLGFFGSIILLAITWRVGAFVRECITGETWS